MKSMRFQLFGLDQSIYSLDYSYLLVNGSTLKKTDKWKNNNKANLDYNKNI